MLAFRRETIDEIVLKITAVMCTRTAPSSARYRFARLCAIS